MKKDGKYRFSLQFGMNSAEEVAVGELLEQLGNRKSVIVVAALNEYLQKHPELQSRDCKIQVQFSGADQNQLEDIVRRLVEERLSGIQITEKMESENQNASVQVSDDIMDMLSDLDMFQI